MPTRWELMKGGKRDLLLRAQRLGWKGLTKHCGFADWGAWGAEKRDVVAEVAAHARAAAERGQPMPSGWELMRDPGRRPRPNSAYRPALRELVRSQPGGWRGTASQCGLTVRQTAPAPDDVDCVTAAARIARGRCPGRMPNGWEMLQPGPGLRMPAPQLRRQVLVRGYRKVAQEADLLPFGPKHGMPLLVRLPPADASGQRTAVGLRALLATGTCGVGLSAVVAALLPSLGSLRSRAAHRALPETPPEPALQPVTHRDSLRTAAATRPLPETPKARVSVRTLAARLRLPSLRTEAAAVGLPPPRVWNELSVEIPESSSDSSSGPVEAKRRQWATRTTEPSLSDDAFPPVAESIPDSEPEVPTPGRTRSMRTKAAAVRLPAARDEAAASPLPSSSSSSSAATAGTAGPFPNLRMLAAAARPLIPRWIWKSVAGRRSPRSTPSSTPSAVAAALEREYDRQVTAGLLPAGPSTPTEYDAGIARFLSADSEDDAACAIQRMYRTAAAKEEAVRRRYDSLVRAAIQYERRRAAAILVQRWWKRERAVRREYDAQVLAILRSQLPGGLYPATSLLLAASTRRRTSLRSVAAATPLPTRGSLRSVAAAAPLPGSFLQRHSVRTAAALQPLPDSRLEAASCALPRDSLRSEAAAVRLPDSPRKRSMRTVGAGAALPGTPRRRSLRTSAASYPLPGSARGSLRTVGAAIDLPADDARRSLRWEAAALPLPEERPSLRTAAASWPLPGSPRQSLRTAAATHQLPE
eukprot:TRINITY_DN17376_c0_g1_i1.p1 TRINITY_DN17376_c0_g1~~TRINITY_DN17376_c0_g1_i1.p1  ORF type:complete len:821 (+),score=209.47 TRINITY_DN17376_c0_g1_i1:200-2464(+)